MASLRQSFMAARTPIVILFTYRIVSLALGFLFTPPPIARLFLELLYWLIYASIGWSLGRVGLGKSLSVAAVTALVFAAEFGILLIYFAWLAGGRVVVLTLVGLRLHHRGICGSKNASCWRLTCLYGLPPFPQREVD